MTPMQPDLPVATLRGGSARDPRRGLLTFVWAFVGVHALYVIVSVFQSLLMASLDAPGVDFESLDTQWKAALWVGQVGGWIAIAAMIAGLVEYLAIARETGARPLIAGALVALAALAVMQVGSFVYTEFLVDRAEANYDLMRWVWSALQAVTIAVVVLVVAAITRVTRRAGGAPSLVLSAVAVAAAVAIYGFPIVRDRLWPDWRYSFEHPWIWQGIWVPVQLALWGSLLSLARRQLASAGEPMSLPWGAGADAIASPQGVALLAAQGGLTTYSRGLTARIIVVLVGYLFLYLSLDSRTTAAFEGTLIVMTLGSLITTGIMLAGLARYAAVPVASGARGPAVGALSLFAIAGLIELYTAFLVLELVSATDSSRVLELVGKLSALGGFTQVATLASLLLLLLSFANLSRYLGERALLTSSAIVAVLVLVIAMGVVALRASLSSTRGAPEDLIGWLVMLLIGAVVTITLYLGLINRVVRAIQVRIVGDG